MLAPLVGVPFHRAHTHIVHAQQPIAGLDAAGLEHRPVRPHVRHDQRTVAAAAQRQPQAVVLALHANLRQLGGHAQAALRHVLGQAVLDLENRGSVAVQQNALHMLVAEANGCDAIDVVQPIAGRQKITGRSVRTDGRDDRRIAEIRSLGEADAQRGGGGVVARQRYGRIGGGAAIGGQAGVLRLGRAHGAFACCCLGGGAHGRSGTGLESGWQRRMTCDGEHAP